MKKIKYVMLAAALIITATGCSKSDDEVTPIYNEQRVEYNINDSYMVKLYEGNMYAASLYINEDNWEAKDMTVHVFDDTGEKIREFTLDGISGMSCWDIYGDTVYVVEQITVLREGTYVNRVLLYSADINTGETSEIFEFKTLSSVKKIKVIDNKLYWLGQKDSYDPFSDTLYFDSGETINYAYEGKVFGCYDLDSGINTESGIDYPEVFSERNGQVVIYAFEKDKGYCFFDYASNTVLSYTNKLNDIRDFEFINDNMDFVFCGNASYNGSLVFSGMNNESGVIQIEDDMWVNRISAEGDHICVQASDNLYSLEEKVYKYYVNISTSDPPIKVITSSMDIARAPLFSCGYQVKTRMLSGDGFALTVLSLDKGYDLAMMNTRESYANEMKEKGSFYPLNDIPGVKEYIDSCFPYIKEAATAENGDIWMLPVVVEVPVIIYNEKNCADNNISFPRELGAFLDEMKKASEISKYYRCGRYDVICSATNSYLSQNNSFDTDTFRSIASLLKENYNAVFFKDYLFEAFDAMYQKQLERKMGDTVGDVYYDAIYKKTLFHDNNTVSSQREFAGDENLRAAALPSVNGKSSAECQFVCVNPNSEHLAETLLFIEKTVSRFAEKENSFTLKDKSLYSDDPYTMDLYEIYENSQITFTMPWEIYQDDFNSYLNGDIDLEQFITEADRKLSAYLNE